MTNSLLAMLVVVGSWPWLSLTTAADAKPLDPQESVVDNQNAYRPAQPTLQVAALKLDWTDTRRNRSVPVKIYYPQNVAGPFPVIVFSHGLGGTRDGYEYLGRHWAGCGYVSVHLQHLGSDDAAWKNVPQAQRLEEMRKHASDLSNAIQRPLDVRFAIDELTRLNADPKSPLAGRLNLAAIGISGHSFGGYTTLASVGQSFAGANGNRFSLGDPRIKAAVAMSAPPPAARQDPDASYGSIKIPVMHMTGTEDTSIIQPNVKAADRRIPYDHMAHAETCLVTFQGGDHMIFSGRGRMGGTPAKLAQDAEFQKLICTGTTAFWDAYLKNQPAAKTWLLQGGYAQILGPQAAFESRPDPIDAGRSQKSQKSIPSRRPD